MRDSVSATSGERRLDATPVGDEAERIRTDLLSNAPYYDFFYAVGMMERLHPDAIRVGGEGPYSKEAIRFHHSSSLAFDPGDLARVEWREKPRSPEDRLEQSEHRFEVTTTFLGLTGSSTPLPLYLAEEITQYEDVDPVRPEFLDLFHHRVVSFVYRIGVKYDLAREYSADGSDPWSRRVLALAGYDAYDGRRPRHLPLWRLLRLAPLLVSRPRSARTFQVALEDVCHEALEGATVRIEQFAGDWDPLDTEQRMALGRLNNRLGDDAVLGVQCYDRAGRAVVVIGPLGENFRRFLADGDMYLVLIELLDLLREEPIDFELDLVLSQKARPPFYLGQHLGGRVGVDSWLSSRQGPSSETHLRVPLPLQLPEGDRFDLGWQSKPQR